MACYRPSLPTAAFLHVQLKCLRPSGAYVPTRGQPSRTFAPYGIALQTAFRNSPTEDVDQGWGAELEEASKLLTDGPSRRSLRFQAT